MQAVQLTSRAFVARRPTVTRGNNASQRARVTVSAVAVDTSKLSAEQLAFLERKRSESASPSSAAPSRGRSAAPPATNGLSAEQKEFLARKARETSASPAPQPTRGRSGSVRPSSRAPTPPPAAPAPSAYSAPAPAGGLSAEQQEFLARRARERSASPTPQASRGRSGSVRPSSRPAAAAPASAPAARGSYRHVTPEEQAKLSAEQCDFLERKRAGL